VRRCGRRWDRQRLGQVAVAVTAKLAAMAGVNPVYSWIVSAAAAADVHS